MINIYIALLLLVLLLLVSPLSLLCSKHHTRAATIGNVYLWCRRRSIPSLASATDYTAMLLRIKQLQQPQQHRSRKPRSRLSLLMEARYWWDRLPESRRRWISKRHRDANNKSTNCPTDFKARQPSIACQTYWVCFGSGRPEWINRRIIVISKLSTHHSKAKSRAPAYSRALRQIRGTVQRIVRGRFKSGCQRVRGGRLGVKAGAF